MAGFGPGGVLDGLCPGADLALLLQGTGGLGRLGDGELTGVVRGWRRLSSWAAAMELAAVAEVARRCVGAARSGGRCASEAERWAAAEVGAALNLTRWGAEALVGRALSVTGLAATWAALARGAIDVPRALVIADGVAGLGGELACRVESAVVSKAPSRTTGELRRDVARAVVAADPAAADRRLAEAVKQARVERWVESPGTAAIAGRGLPPADVLAAGNRINALAAALKADGAEDRMDLLRARVFMGLLLDRPAAAVEHGTPGGDDPTGGAPPATGARVSTAGPAGAVTAGGLAGADMAGGITEAGESWTAGSAAAGDAAAGDATAARSATFRDATAGDATAAGNATIRKAAARSATSSDATSRDATAIGNATSRDATGVGGMTTADVATARGATGADAAGGLPGGIAAAVTLTVPLRMLLGLPGEPAEVGGFGPVSPLLAAEILAQASGGAPVRWCVTVTDDEGRATGHGCAAATATAGRRVPGGGWALTVKVRALAVGGCTHQREADSYQPPRSLRHMIEARHTTCVFPGCGRPSRQCDLDHTTPYGRGGRTCECNMAPLCRTHHKVKQAPGWLLAQPAPGVLQWTTPSGWNYTVLPDAHPI